MDLTVKNKKEFLRTILRKIPHEKLYISVLEIEPSFKIDYREGFFGYTHDISGGSISTARDESSVKECLIRFLIDLEEKRGNKK